MDMGSVRFEVVSSVIPPPFFDHMERDLYYRLTNILFRGTQQWALSTAARYPEKILRLNN